MRRIILLITLLSLSGCSPFSMGNLIKAGVYILPQAFDELPAPSNEEDTTDEAELKQ